jgi:hypothetical protein
VLTVGLGKLAFSLEMFLCPALDFPLILEWLFPGNFHVVSLPRMMNIVKLTFCICVPFCVTDVAIVDDAR